MESCCHLIGPVVVQAMDVACAPEGSPEAGERGSRTPPAFGGTEGMCSGALEWRLAACLRARGTWAGAWLGCAPLACTRTQHGHRRCDAGDCGGNLCPLLARLAWGTRSRWALLGGKGAPVDTCVCTHPPEEAYGVDGGGGGGGGSGGLAEGSGGDGSQTWLEGLVPGEMPGWSRA